jgi:hypothetical protein
MEVTAMTTRQYLVTIHDSGNVTDKAENIRTILTSTDHILPRERVEVREYRFGGFPEEES